MNVSSVGAGLPPAQFAAEYGVRVLELQKDAIQAQGAAALQLIEAVANNSAAPTLDVRA